MTDNTKNSIIALRIHIDGLVQGVGFRPFVYRLAHKYGLQGWVVNRTDGITMKIEGSASEMPLFVEDLRYKAPVVSQIDEMTVDQDFPEGLVGFSILASQDLNNETSEICPDIAVCPDCLSDMKTQAHRKNYPFINCTNCGPRFSIVRSFPYDRNNTTMESFGLCPVCKKEYTDILDRRFHAQPVACNACGPSYSLHTGSGVSSDFKEIIEQVQVMIESGKIMAIKGIGGFHLMCDAFNEQAVNRLRKLKRREGKPFAVMFRDLESIRQYAGVSEEEATALLSWRKPIVILRTAGSIPAGITLGLNTLGAFLPYMPIHYLIFEKISTPAVVLTSGNFTDEPVIIHNLQALESFLPAVDAVVTYNREIYNRNDDSVVRIIAGNESLQRRSRGYVPAPIKTGFNADGILATGAELSNCFCMGKGDRAYMSQHIGDLRNYETLAFYEETILRFQSIFRTVPTIAAADMHPDYLSTRYARKLGIDVIEVQHHHAHIAACMAENGVDEPVIGVAFDGTGYGSDGHTWGSEFMICDLESFERKSHFNYMPVPGGDKASQEPWRMGIAILYQVFGNDFRNLNIPLLKMIEKSKIAQITEALDKKINCPLSSGAGRLFDGLAAISGICTNSLFHAEAPMRFESAVEPGIRESYGFEMNHTISFSQAIRDFCHDLTHGVPVNNTAAKFHNTIVEATLQMILKLREQTGLQKVVLSGGTFQNKYLLESLVTRLLNNNLAVYTHRKVPCNDGGLALGQLVIAAKKTQNKRTCV